MSGSTPSPRGPYAKTRGRVEAVRRTAFELVVESGHRSVTIAEVARRADLTEAQVLYHFPSREHLLVGALEHADRRSRAHQQVGVADVRAAVAATVEAERSDPEVLRLFVAMSAAATDPTHPAHEWGARRTRAIVARYAELLTDLQAQGWADPGVDPHRFARRFMALWDGLQTQWLLDPTFDLGREVADGLAVLAGRAEIPGPRGGGPAQDA
ncbi:TetR/AcrR family transcriptional regulator [Cellulomonas sp. Y8]|uniref:TetR/AcrR family transcriptional regulator n=1 Tax=Cellulomonas sp. Y8 TaxID=2591145 RepID=UPI0011C89977|nr:TetR/AcrR family transcriptional regulator [Cellulomonas sp. Y8]